MNKINQILEIVREANGFIIPKDLPLPVKYDGISYYWGKDGEIVADFDEGVNVGDGFRIRGWGRIQNEESQDECAKWIADAINAYGSVYPHHLLVALDTTKEIGITEWFVGSNGQFDKRTKDGSPLFKLNLTQPLESQLQANPELVEVIYKLLIK